MSHQLHSNAAGGPLPAIPRRPTNSRSTAVFSQRTTRRGPKSPYRMQRSSSCSDSDGHSGSTNSTSPVLGAPLTLRARRARGPNPPQFPESLSTAGLSSLSDVPSFGSLRASKTEDNITQAGKRDPTSRPKVYVPGMLKLSQGSTSSKELLKTAPGRAADDTGLVRKKSGQLVKPSLKTSKSANSDSFSALTGSTSRSEPTTPVCKAVHFDAQLEHVKLFLAEQKPLAVSRDGSPTDDTSGTDSDFPSFIFGPSNARRRGKLLIDVVNMPPRVNTYADVVLEKLWISSDDSSILGSVRVRNVAFAKLVAVRFTFDSWQTTSEVTGRYQESISPEFDRFAFTIMLTDLLARIEEKTLILAIRYSSAGQEFWDNNHTLNYVGKFTRSIRDRSLSDEEGDTRGNLESLQNKLEKVKEGSERIGPAFVAAQNAKAAVAVEADSDGPTFKSTSSFASRYDFSTSLKNPWKYQETQPTHHRSNSFPQISKPSPAPAVQSAPNLGSPRDVGEGAVPPSATSSHDDQVPFLATPQPRNHRRGYFDLNNFNATSVKLTPPTSPEDDIHTMILGEPLEPLCKRSVPTAPPPRAPLVNMSSFGFFMSSGDGFDSELSTPSLATPTSSRETTPSPTERFAELPSGSDSDAAHSPDTHYRDLINQYCFFTGSDPEKSSSKSCLYNFAGSAKYAASEQTPESTPTLAPQPRLAAEFSPQRSPSTDDIVYIKSTSVTPTASTTNIRSLNESESRSATPVPVPTSA